VDTVLKNLQKIKPAGTDMEILVIKGTWPPLQRNMGIREATGDYIFLFDDDIIIPPGSIEKALETFQNNPDIHVVGGPNLTPPENDYLQHCFGYAHASPFVGLETAVRYHPTYGLKKVTEKHLISCNLAFQAKTLKENHFDPNVFPNEENELMARLTKKGFLLAYNPEFFVYHHRRKNLPAFFKQIFNWGRGRTIHSIKKPDHFDAFFFAPLIFVLYLISLIWYRESWYLYPLYAYLLTDLAASLEAAYTHKNWSSPGVTFWLFPMTHLTYAFGLLAGFSTLWESEKKLPEEKEFLLIKVELF